jgi:AcrR family transcriptional regulator
MAERRERILAAAQEIIGEHGYQALTMRELAQASRVTVPTIYNLIGSKEAVLFAAVEYRTDHYVERLAASEGAAPCERVLSIVDACVDEFLSLPHYYRSMLGLIYASQSAGSMRLRTSRAVREPIAQALIELSAAGELAAWIDPRSLANQIESLVQVASLRWATGSMTDADLRHAATHGAALLLLGVTAESQRARLEELARGSQAHGHSPPAAPSESAERVRSSS